MVRNVHINQDTDKDIATLDEDYLEQLRATRKAESYAKKHWEGVDMAKTYFTGWITTPEGMVEVWKEKPNEKTS